MEVCSVRSGNGGRRNEAGIVQAAGDLSMVVRTCDFPVDRRRRTPAAFRHLGEMAGTRIAVRAGMVHRGDDGSVGLGCFSPEGVPVLAAAGRMVLLDSLFIRPVSDPDPGTGRQDSAQGCTDRLPFQSPADSHGAEALRRRS